MNTSDSFADLVRRLQQGDSSAADAIVRRYSDELVRMASHRIVGALRRKLDPEDVVQSAFRSFFGIDFAAAPPVLRDWRDLWSYLLNITLRKCSRNWRQYLTGKRNITLEGDDTSANEEPARAPTPAEAIALTDLVCAIISRLCEEDRRIAEALMAGRTNREIAEELGVTERTVFRRMERIRTACAALDQS
jgi:RNA polymerase sigma factor (sigma-70 family)